jgi:hypothetical protein
LWGRDDDMMIYLLTVIGLSAGGRSTVHIYTQTIHRTIQNNTQNNTNTVTVVVFVLK